jgi:ribonucleoside-diphosphate reductase alpha chain
MRNSNTMAIAPTATISNIVGSIPGNEPIYKNIYVKSNISGDFIVINEFLVDDLKKIGLWDSEMLGAIKYNDGSLANIPNVPLELKQKYKETFEIDMRWLVKAGAARGKWIDQSQSLNIFFSGTSGSELSDLYLYAWEMGLKTTYYLRSLGASQVEKSTVGTAGTHLRKGVEGEAKGGVPVVSPVDTEAGALAGASVVAEMVQLPVSVPSPITRSEIRAEKVVEAIQKEVLDPAAVAGKPKIKLHVAEDAICESCQ